MQYKALFLDEDLNEIGNKTFESTDEFLTWKKGTFNIRLNAYLYKNKDTTFYGYIYPTDEKLLIDVRIEPIIKNNEEKENKEKESKDKKPKETIKIYSARIIKIKEKIEKGDLKLIVGESIIGQLARLAVLGLKQNWLLIIIIGAICAIAGGGIAYTLGVSNGVNQGFNQAQIIYNATIKANPTPILVYP